MTIWKLLFDIKTPTWERFGCVAFAEADTEDEARAIAMAKAAAEYPQTQIIPFSLRVSTPQAVAAYEDLLRRNRIWQANVRAGRPNARGDL